MIYDWSQTYDRSHIFLPESGIRPKSHLSTGVTSFDQSRAYDQSHAYDQSRAYEQSHTYDWSHVF
jgi:hypothetical protein